ncbi:MAG: PEP-CTERM sorting domain-containing protein [Phycisphaeraceae bacterium]|nr:PEP-CTERM sorting domain-containing protein [Phycisphaeraceae bacterium]
MIRFVVVVLLLGAMLIPTEAAAAMESAWERFVIPDAPYHFSTVWSSWAHDGGVYIGGGIDNFFGGSAITAGHIASYDRMGNLQWSTVLSDTPAGSGSTVIHELQAHPSGDQFAVGYTNRLLSEAVAERQELVVLRIDDQGSVVWGKQLPNAQPVFGSSIQFTTQGLIVGGSTQSYRPGTFGDVLDQSDLQLTAMDLSGNVLWQQTYPTAHNEIVYELALDSHGNIYAAGARSEDVQGVADIWQDVFVRKFSPSGEPLWTKTLDSGASENAPAMLIDSRDRIFVAGYTDGPLDGVSEAEGSTPFLIRLDTEGQTQFIRQYEGSDPAGAVAIAQSDNGDLLLAGSVSVGEYTAGLTENYTDTLILRIAPDGSLIESKQLDTSHYERFFTVSVYGDDVYVGGFSQAVVDIHGESYPRSVGYVSRLVVPEPGSIALLGTAFVLIGLRRRRG